MMSKVNVYLISICTLFLSCRSEVDKNKSKSPDVNRNGQEMLETQRLIQARKTADSIRLQNYVDTKILHLESNNSTKYLYVQVKTKKPLYERSEYTGNTILVWQEHIYTSDVIQVDDFSEAKKFNIMDGFVKNLRLSWAEDPQHGQRSEEKVMERESMIFSSYSEASDSKFKAATDE